MAPKSPPVSPPSSPTSRPLATTNSPPRSPSSRGSSIGGSSRRDQFYAPAQPSGLRNSTVPEVTPVPSPEDRFSPFFERQTEQDEVQISSRGSLDSQPLDAEAPNERTRLLSSGSIDEASAAFSRKTSIRPRVSRHYDSFNSLMHDPTAGRAYPGDADSVRSIRTDTGLHEAIDSILAEAESESMATTKRLAAKYGISGRTRM